MAANYPFCTIEPNHGVALVKDERIDKLAELSRSEKKIYATVNFTDIAGLVKGASTGSGLGNQFLAHIREVDLIIFLLRAFEDPEVVLEGSISPVDDLATLQTELILKDLETIAKAIDAKKGKFCLEEKTLLEKAKNCLDKGKMISAEKWGREEEEILRPLCFLTYKPYLTLLNVDETDLNKPVEKFGLTEESAMLVSAKVEFELAALSETEQKDYLESLGLTEAPVAVVIRRVFHDLDLITFLTTGEKESRAWTIHEGSTAVEASGEIHTDFMKKFIKAKICDYTNFVSLGNWPAISTAGKLRLEGKDYVMKDGDVVEFLIGQ